MRRSVTCLVMILTLISVCLCGCSVSTRKINSLDFISATGNPQATNCLFVSSFDVSFEENGAYDAANLSSEQALNLINEIEAIPDAVNGQGQFAFKIELIYTDEEGKVHEVEKEGYGSFPDNWDTVVDLTNAVTENKAGITKSRDIVSIDRDYLITNYGISDDMLPEKVTIDDLIRDYPITYETLYDPKSDFDIEKAVYDYTYGYYEMASHRLYEFMPSASTSAELNAFASHRLDTVDGEGTSFVTGTCGGYVFEIYKYDEFEAIVANNESMSLVPGDGGVFGYHYEDGSETKDLDIYLDSSNRFVVMTDCKDLNLIYSVIR